MSDIPDQLNKKVARALHDQGFEMTPDEVITTRKQAHVKLRKALRARGLHPPDGDMEFLSWMSKIMKGSRS